MANIKSKLEDIEKRALEKKGELQGRMKQRKQETESDPKL